jgi:hypothetical protein
LPAKADVTARASRLQFDARKSEAALSVASIAEKAYQRPPLARVRRFML